MLFSFFAWGGRWGGPCLFPECWKHLVAQSLAKVLEPHGPSWMGFFTVAKNRCFSSRT